MNQSESLSWSFSDFSGGSKESACADNMKLKSTENCPSSYQTHVTEVVKDFCDNWTVFFCNVFGQGWVFLMFEVG
jgi:hypothetical protein